MSSTWAPLKTTTQLQAERGAGNGPQLAAAEIATLTYRIEALQARVSSFEEPADPRAFICSGQESRDDLEARMSALRARIQILRERGSAG